MSEVEVRNGKAYCEKCGTEVSVKEKPGDQPKAQERHVLVGDCGHVVGERLTPDQPWHSAA